MLAYAGIMPDVCFSDLCKFNCECSKNRKRNLRNMANEGFNA